MTTKLEEVIALGNQAAAERASYAITVQAGLDAGTLVDHESAIRLLNEMKDVSRLDELEVPAEVQTALVSAMDELISSL
jgi:hypothetical protein